MDARRAAAAPTATPAPAAAAKDEALPLWRVLAEELAHLRPARAAGGAPQPTAGGAPQPAAAGGAPPHATPGSGAPADAVTTPAADRVPDAHAAAAAAAGSEQLAAHFRRVHGLATPLSALCFSGGGIRSATFNLGVIQGLAKLGLLEKFDYLSSVSGGGYIAGWLARWVYSRRESGGLEAVVQALAAPAPRDPQAPEAPEVTYLRRFSNYLTPRLGLLSADTWTLIAIGLRNVLLNWLVLLPLLAAPLVIPLLAVARWTAAGPAAAGAGQDTGLLIAACVLETVGIFSLSWLRNAGAMGGARPPYLRFGLLPRLAALPLLLLGIDRHFMSAAAADPSWSDLFVPSLVWAVGLPLLALWASGPLLGRKLSALLWDTVSLIVAGAISAVILAAVVAGWAPALVRSPCPLYPILGAGLIIGPMLLGRTLFVAISSIAEHWQSVEFGDADREWWSRWSAWELIVMVVWIGGSALVLFAPTLLATVQALVAAMVSAGGLGTLVAAMGSSGATPASKDVKGGGGGRLTSLLSAIAVPLFVVAVALCLALGVQHLLARIDPAPGRPWPPPPAAGSHFVPPYAGRGAVELAAIAALAALGALAGYPVNVNRFSMQAGYRNRLIRAYLGASNDRRRPNLFTGFDQDDNVLLGSLRQNRPLPFVNMTLNLVRGQNLAWQERKAECFTATPLHCGAPTVGYRRTECYGGHDGLSLGTAVATSGAAANPNMGFNSSPTITLVMTLFTVRLGIWLGNPRLSGRMAPYRRSGPRFSARVLLAEAFGWTDDRHPYISLSDGGHFEDLGLYEMVRRRCRTIVVCDAGADPAYGFKDLGNAIRKIRIDFGVPIVFTDRVYILPKQASGQAASDQARYCAVAEIRYGEVDAGAVMGTLIYVKPSICEQPPPPTPFDVSNYARFSRDFPHESTADQWFDETQFESYRALGEDAVTAIGLAKPCPSLEELVHRVKDVYLPRTERAGEGQAV